MTSPRAIEPALTPKAWASIDRGDDLPYGYGSSVLDDLSVLDEEDIRAAIAYLNDRLPDNDPRKITRERLTALRSAIDSERQRIDVLPNVYPFADLVPLALGKFVDALESYLPPSPNPHEA